MSFAFDGPAMHTDVRSARMARSTRGTGHAPGGARPLPAPMPKSG